MVRQCIETRARTAFVTGSEVGSFPGVLAGGGDTLSFWIEADLSLGAFMSIEVGERTGFGLCASLEQFLERLWIQARKGSGQ